MSRLDGINIVVDGLRSDVLSSEASDAVSAFLFSLHSRCSGFHLCISFRLPQTPLRTVTINRDHFSNWTVLDLDRLCFIIATVELYVCFFVIISQIVEVVLVVIQCEWTSRRRLFLLSTHPTE